MTAQDAFWAGAAAAVALALLSGVMDWRRSRRRDFDAVGWVPWRGVQVTAFFAAAACVMLAMQA